MNTEQKARAYDEAIKRAKALIKVADNQDEAIDFTNTIFPELEESEDEMIRKEIIYHIKNCDDTIDEETEKRMLNWLEKQYEKDEEILILKDQIESLHAAIKAIKETNKIKLEILSKQNLTNSTKTCKDAQKSACGEDNEKIRKAIVDFFNEPGRKEYILNGFTVDNIITWLEKQGTSYTKKDIDDAYLKDVTNTKNEIEKQYEANYQIRKDIATFIFNYKGDIKDRAKWIDYLGINVSFVEEQNEQKETLCDTCRKAQPSHSCQDITALGRCALEKQCEQKTIMNAPSREVILAIWDLGNEWKGLTNGSISTEYGTQLDYIQKHWEESEYYLKEKQMEQKDTDKTEPKFHEGQWINGGIVYEDFNEGDGYYKVNLAYLSKSQVELIENLVASWQTSANNSIEWSEEDYNKISSIKYLLHELDNHNFDDWFDKIKSLKPQQKQEWSEDDENMLRRVFDSLNTYAKGSYPILKGVVEEEIDWLKTLKHKKLFSENDKERIKHITSFIWKNRKGDTDEIFQQEQDVKWLNSLI